MEKTKGNIGFRKPMLAAVGIVLVAGGLLVGVEGWLAHRARKVIEQKLSQNGIRLEIGSVRVGLIPRSIRLNDVSMEIEGNEVSAGETSRPSVRMELEQLEIGGVHWGKQQGKRAIRLDRILLKSPHVELDHRVEVAGRTVSSISLDSLSSEKSPQKWTEQLSIGQIQIADGSLSYHLHRGVELSTYTVEGLQMQVDDFEPDSLWTQNLLSAGHVQVAMDRVEYAYDDRAFLLEADTLVLKNHPTTVSVEAVRLLPQYPKDQFAQQSPGHTDWMQVVSGPITLSGLTICPGAARPEVRADSLRVRDLTFDCYKNRKIPQPSRKKALFFQSLQRLPVGLQIDKIYLQNLNAMYEELSPKGEEPGLISFNDLQAEISGLTNLPSSGRLFYRLDARCRLMDTADLQATFRLPIDSLTDRFEVSGKLGRMPMKALNPVVGPLVGAEILQGTVRGMDFEIHGSATRSAVDLTLLYDGLEVEIIQNKHGKLREKVLATYLVDHFLLRNGNPNRHGMHQGEGTFIRDPYRSQFNYLWKSLWPGIKKTLI